jgi:hypothetical protein
VPSRACVRPCSPLATGHLVMVMALDIMALVVYDAINNQGGETNDHMTDQTNRLGYMACEMACPRGDAYRSGCISSDPYNRNMVRPVLSMSPTNCMEVQHGLDRKNEPAV